MVFEDDISTVRATENTINISQLRHLGKLYHQIRDFVQEGTIIIMHITSANQLADLLTKPLANASHSRLVYSMLNFMLVSSFVHHFLP